MCTCESCFVTRFVHIALHIRDIPFIVRDSILMALHVVLFYNTPLRLKYIYPTRDAIFLHFFFVFIKLLKTTLRVGVFLNKITIARNVFFFFKLIPFKFCDATMADDAIKYDIQN